MLRFGVLALDTHAKDTEFVCTPQLVLRDGISCWCGGSFVWRRGRLITPAWRLLDEHLPKRKRGAWPHRKENAGLGRTEKKTRGLAAPKRKRGAWPHRKGNAGLGRTEKETRGLAAQKRFGLHGWRLVAWCASFLVGAAPGCIYVGTR
eukprot:scaffold5297_cov110-Isochrysis_galbana.AAC.8